MPILLVPTLSEAVFTSASPAATPTRRLRNPHTYRHGTPGVVRHELSVIVGTGMANSSAADVEGVGSAGSDLPDRLSDHMLSAASPSQTEERNTGIRWPS
jgi:hypothetical protein